jgi:hypothetical protein
VDTAAGRERPGIGLGAAGYVPHSAAQSPLFNTGNPAYGMQQGNTAPPADVCSTRS